MSLYAQFIPILIPLLLMFLSFACLIITRKDRERNAYARVVLLVVFTFMLLSDQASMFKNDWRGWSHLLSVFGLAAYAGYKFLQLSLRGRRNSLSTISKAEA